MSVFFFSRIEFDKRKMWKMFALKCIQDMFHFSVFLNLILIPNTIDYVVSSDFYPLLYFIFNLFVGSSCFTLLAEGCVSQFLRK